MFANRLRQRERTSLTFLFALGFSLLLSLSSLMPSQAIPVSEVPNPRQDNNWVMDMADVLSPDSEAQLNQMITALEARNGAEIAVVTVPDTQPSATPKAFTTELFNTWGIGKKGEDNGILFLVSKNERRTEIETGYGVESILPDAKVGNILRTQVTPYFKQGNFDTGIVKGTQAIIQVLEGGTIAPPTREESGESVDLGWLIWIFENFDLIIKGIVGFIATGVVTATSFVLVKVVRKSHSFKFAPVGRTTYEEKRDTSLNLMGLWVWVLRWLAGDVTSHDGPRRPLKTRLVFNPTTEVFQSWCTFLGLAIGLWLASSIIEGYSALKLLLIWGWFGFEIWCCNKRDENGASAVITTLSKLLIFGLVAVPVVLIVASSIRSINVFVALFAAVGGASAGTLRLLRSPSCNIDVRCQSCNGLMQYLGDQTLDEYLKPAEKVAKEIGSTQFEGWQCPTCSSAQADMGFDLHLFQEVLNPYKFSHCDDCNAFTVTSTSEILEKATTTSKGEELLTRECACCHQKTEERVTIPRVSKTSYSSSSASSYSSSYDSGSSYSGGDYGGSSGGSDFGGGSSGGGGAGESW